MERTRNLVLLVEDNADDELLTLRALRAHDLADEVVVARDGAEALDYLFGTGAYAGRDLAQMPRVALLDIKLPKLDGLEVLQRMRAAEATRYLPVIILTSSSEEEDLIQSYALGANSYIRKPVEYPLFMEAVRQLGQYWLVWNEVPHDSGCQAHAEE
jgi:two-component system, response regulator